MTPLLGRFFQAINIRLRIECQMVCRGYVSRALSLELPALSCIVAA